MTLGDIYNLVEYICNKDFDGNIITPDRFNQLIKVVNIDLFRQKYGIPEEYQPGRPIPMEYADVTLKNTDDLKAFKTRLANRTVASGVMLFPADYAHVTSVVYNFIKNINGVDTTLPRQVEMLREAEFASREGNYTKRPTTMNPIGIIRSDGIHIRPITITACDLNYYRFPVNPIFGYVQGDGYITYDATTSTELEWTVDEHLTLTRMLLQMIGVNLRSEEIVQYSELKLKEG